jgi:ubiquinone/menaquinone biosynthesis C-methylase UbiE
MDAAGRSTGLDGADRFERDANEWLGVYGRRDVLAATIQHRLKVALTCLESLRLPTGSSVLEVGSGAGVAAVALARRGFNVSAVDPAPAMRELTRANAIAAGVSGQVQILDGDIADLPFPADHFDVVIALGVLPWVPDPDRAIGELARVACPGGHVIVSASNRRALPEPVPHINSMRRPQLARLLAARGLTIVDAAAFGFGPFTVFGRVVVPTETGLALGRSLDQFARRHRWFGEQFAEQSVVLAERPGG